MCDYVSIHCIYAKSLVYSAQSASILKLDLTNKHDSINKELFHLPLSFLKSICFLFMIMAAEEII